MQISNFLAYIWGIFLIVMPLSLLINPKKIKSIFEMAMNETTVYYNGIASFIIGLITLFLNNSWNYNWKSIVTVLGLASLIKGCFSLFLPQEAARINGRMKDKEWIFYLLFAAIFIGLFTVYFAFIGK